MDLLALISSGSWFGVSLASTISSLQLPYKPPRRLNLGFVKLTRCYLLMIMSVTITNQTVHWVAESWVLCPSMPRTSFTWQVTFQQRQLFQPQVRFAKLIHTKSLMRRFIHALPYLLLQLWSSIEVRQAPISKTRALWLPLLANFSRCCPWKSPRNLLNFATIGTRYH